MQNHMIPGPGGAMIFAPDLMPDQVKTYEIEQELVEVTCEDAFCHDYLFGFVTRVDETTDLGQRQAHFIRHDKSREHLEESDESGLTRFTFPPGTKCFAPPDRPRHTKPQEGTERLLEYVGDWRGVAGSFIEHDRAEVFLQSWAEHQQRLKDAIERG